MSSNIVNQLICPICGKIYIDCLAIGDNICKYCAIEGCTDSCECSVTEMLKALQSQIYQLQIENESLLHERNVWKIFCNYKGES